MRKYLRIFTVISFVIVIGSCSKNKDASCQTCTTKTPDFEKSVSLVNKSSNQITIDMRFWKTLFKNKPDYFYSTYKDNQAEDEYDKINLFMASIVGNSIKDEFLSENNYSFTLFLDGDISKTQTFLEEDILGFNIYHVSNNYLYHKFFVNNGNSFIENKRLAVKVKGIDAAELYGLAENYFKPKTNSIIALNVGITNHSRAEEFNHSNNVPENLKLKMAYDLSTYRGEEVEEDLFL